MDVSLLDHDEGGKIALIPRDAMQAIAYAPETSAALRTKLVDLLERALYGTIWVYPDGETDTELLAAVASL